MKWYSVKELCSECGNVSKNSWDRFNREVLSVSPDTQKEIQEFAVSPMIQRTRQDRSHAKEYSEEVLKAFQSWLMRNQANQGKGSELVKEATTKAVETDIAISTIISTGNVEAMQCLMQHYINETQVIAKNKQLEQQHIEDQLTIEKKDSQIELLQEQANEAFDKGYTKGRRKWDWMYDRDNY